MKDKIVEALTAVMMAGLTIGVLVLLAAFIAGLAARIYSGVGP